RGVTRAVLASPRAIGRVRQRRRPCVSARKPHAFAHRTARPVLALAACRGRGARSLPAAARRCRTLAGGGAADRRRRVRRAPRLVSPIHRYRRPDRPGTSARGRAHAAGGRAAGVGAGGGVLARQGGAGACAHAVAPQASCRAFVLDTPWSAAFVSWVMRRAGVPAFQSAANHLQYVRRAYSEPFQSPYRVASPLATPVRAGDMLCFVRAATRVYGFAELATVLSNGEPGLGMHCDIVVGISIASDGTRIAHLVGGNVHDTVAMRRLALTPGDRFRDLPLRQPGEPDCSPESAYACD